MGELISTFHIDWSLLLAQFINFAIVFFVLHYYAFRPLSKKIEERKKRIEEGIEHAEKSESILKHSKEEAKNIVREAKNEANALIQEAKKKEQEILQDAEIKAKEERNRIVNEAKVLIDEEKRKAKDSLFSEVSALIPRAVSKILMEDFDEDSQKRYLKKVELMLKEEL